MPHRSHLVIKVLLLKLRSVRSVLIVVAHGTMTLDRGKWSTSLVFCNGITTVSTASSVSGKLQFDRT